MTADLTISVEELVGEAFASTKRRMRLCTKANVPKCCPKCRNNQIQLLDQSMLAVWRCRECRYIWIYEPLIVVRVD